HNRAPFEFPLCCPTKDLPRSQNPHSHKIGRPGPVHHIGSKLPQINGESLRVLLWAWWPSFYLGYWSGGTIKTYPMGRDSAVPWKPFGYGTIQMVSPWRSLNAKRRIGSIREFEFNALGHDMDGREILRD